jgi:hypothetical protein
MRTRPGGGVKVCVFVSAVLTGMCAFAQEIDATQVSSDVGYGYESQTSPLIRLSPQGELISLDGVQRQGGPSFYLGLQTFTNWKLGESWGLTLAADFNQKKSPSASDLDFGILSIQPSLHRTLGSESVGLGANLQRIDIAGQVFREVRGAQVTWTHSETSGNLWMAIADLSSNKHREDSSDLDSSTTSLTLQRHVAQPIAGLEGLDITAFVSRERNERGITELSYSSAMVSSSVQWRWQDLTLSTGISLQQLRFDDTAFPDEPQRVDRAVGLEISAQHEISSRTTLRVEFSEVRNVSSLALYDNTFQQFAVKLHTTW